MRRHKTLAYCIAVRALIDFLLNLRSTIFRFRLTSAYTRADYRALNELAWSGSLKSAVTEPALLCTEPAGFKFQMVVKHDKDRSPELRVRALSGVRSLDQKPSRSLNPLSSFNCLRASIEARDWYLNGIDSRFSSGSVVLRRLLRNPLLLLSLFGYTSALSFRIQPSTSDFLVEVLGSVPPTIDYRNSILVRAHLANMLSETSIPAPGGIEIFSISCKPLTQSSARARDSSGNRSLTQDDPVYLATLAARVGSPTLANSLRNKSQALSVAHTALHLLTGEDPPQLRATSRIVDLRVPEFDGQLSPITSHASFAPHAVSLEHVEVWHGRYLVRDSEWIVVDSGHDPRLVDVAGCVPFSWGAPLTGKAIIKSAPIQEPCVDEALYLSGRVDENWFHWLLETLPGITYLNDLASPQAPIIVRDDLPPSAYEALRVISKHPLRFARKDSSVSVEKLHAWVHQSVFYDSPWSLELDPQFNAQALLALRQQFESSLGNRARFSHRRVASIRRSGYRAIANRKQVENLLSRNDFLLVQAENLSFENQYSLFHNCREAVIQGGAGMANTIFMKPGTKVTVLLSDQHGAVSKWQALLDILDLRSEFVVSRSFLNGAGVHANFKVPLKQMQVALRRT